MPSSTIQAVLFLSSYAPLLVIFAILDSWGRGIPSILCVILAVISSAVLFLFVRKAKELAPLTLSVARASHRDSDAIAYVVTYLVPFTGFTDDNIRLRLALLVLIIVIGALYLRSHLFYVNPLLSLAGYRLYEGETASGRVFILITRRKYVAPETQVTVAAMGNYVFLEREPGEKDGKITSKSGSA
jgi:hypothetical protein